jgi:hypothetical protein
MRWTSWLNIPAPVWVKLKMDLVQEEGSRLKVAVAQADAEASAKVNLLNGPARKALQCLPYRPYRKPTQVGG